eukprot:m.152596 g.152596  ORF g.152596 m.152596 type:complete len:53 (-) comp13304_c1_seq1:94-252(-)
MCDWKRAATMDLQEGCLVTTTKNCNNDKFFGPSRVRFVANFVLFMLVCSVSC